MEELKDVPKESFQYLCRSCLLYDELISIQDVHMEGVYLKEVMEVCASVQPDNDLKYPQNMCKNCILKFYETYRFLSMFNESQTILNCMLKNYRKSHKSFDYGSENIVNNNTEPQSILRNTLEKENSSSIDFKSDNEYYDFEETTDDETVKNETDKESEPVVYLTTKIEQIKSEITNLKTVKYKKRRAVPSGGTVQKRVRITGPPFVCEVCNNSYNTYVEMRKHWQLMSHRPKNFKCNYCSHSFRSTTILQQHIRTHTGEKPNTCHICNRSFNHRSNFIRHMYIHSDSKRYNCTDCPAGFNRLEFLRDHRRKYHAAEKLLCTYCGRAFTCQGTLNVHEKQHTGAKEVKLDPNIPFQCTICGKILASDDLLNAHKERHIRSSYCRSKKIKNDAAFDKREYTCEHCDTCFSNAYQLHVHKLESSCSQYVQRFPCKLCDKVCITYGALYAHQKIHKEEAENVIYECEICAEQFDKERRYKDHVKRHSRERKFVCKDCGQGFFTKMHLENHMRTHTGEKPFICDICGKAFALKVNLTVHKRIHLNVKPFKCVACSHEFRDSSSMRKHIKRHHEVVMKQGNTNILTFTV